MSAQKEIAEQNSSQQHGSSGTNKLPPQNHCSRPPTLPTNRKKWPKATTRPKAASVMRQSGQLINEIKNHQHQTKSSHHMQKRMERTPRTHNSSSRYVV